MPMPKARIFEPQELVDQARDWHAVMEAFGRGGSDPGAYEPRAALVTGGAGFIGSAFVRRLCDAEPACAVVVGGRGSCGVAPSYPCPHTPTLTCGPAAAAG